MHSKHCAPRLLRLKRLAWPPVLRALQPVQPVWRQLACARRPVWPLALPAWPVLLQPAWRQAWPQSPQPVWLVPWQLVSPPVLLQVGRRLLPLALSLLRPGQPVLPLEPWRRQPWFRE